MPVSELPKMFRPPKMASETPKKLTPKDEERQAQDDLVRLFPTMVCGDVQGMKQAVNDARTLYDSKRKTYLRLHVLPGVLRLKKQGSLFGYPLITDVANHLEKLFERKELSDNILMAMYNDVLLLQEILWKKIRGDGGEKGRKILNQLIRIQK